MARSTRRIPNGPSATAQDGSLRGALADGTLLTASRYVIPAGSGMPQPGSPDHPGRRKSRNELQRLA
jgi:hypothetical protein